MFVFWLSVVGVYGWVSRWGPPQEMELKGATVELVGAVWKTGSLRSDRPMDRVKAEGFVGSLKDWYSRGLVRFVHRPSGLEQRVL